MAESITVTTGGTTSVAPEELEAAGDLLGRLADEAMALSFELASVDRLVTMGSLDAMDAPPDAARAEWDIDQAQTVFGEIRAAATGLEWSLKFAADGYIITEKLVGYLFDSGASSGSWIGGLLARLAPAGALVVGAGVAAALTNTHVRSDPTVVSVIREAVTHSGDAAAGALGVPLPTAQLLGALGITGAHTAAGLLAGAGVVVGLTRLTPPRIVSTASATVDDPPVGAADRLDRVPSPSETDSAQVLVERYEIPGEPDVFIAYAAGTVDFDPLVASEPFDMESNVLNGVNGSSASADAVRDALHAAGAEADSRVQLVGYSQGGASVARVAESGDFDVRGILTFGSPTGQIPLPVDIPAVLVEHTDDLVPALGGRQDNDAAVVVTRRMFAEGEVPEDAPVPAHLRTSYSQTARLIDGSSDAKLAVTMAGFDELIAGATRVTSTRYEFDRASG